MSNVKRIRNRNLRAIRLIITAVKTFYDFNNTIDSRSTRNNCLRSPMFCRERKRFLNFFSLSVYVRKTLSSIVYKKRIGIHYAYPGWTGDRILIIINVCMRTRTNEKINERQQVLGDYVGNNNNILL